MQLLQVVHNLLNNAFDGRWAVSQVMLELYLLHIASCRHSMSRVDSSCMTALSLCSVIAVASYISQCSAQYSIMPPWCNDMRPLHVDCSTACSAPNVHESSGGSLPGYLASCLAYATAWMVCELDCELDCELVQASGADRTSGQNCRAL